MMAATDAPGAIKQNQSLKIDTSKPTLPQVPVPPVAPVNMEEGIVIPQEGEIDPALYYAANGYPGAQYMYGDYTMGYAESPGVSSEQWEDYIRSLGMDDPAQTPQGYAFGQPQFFPATAPTVGPDGQLYGHPMAFQYPGQIYQQQGPPQGGGMGQQYMPTMNGAQGNGPEGGAPNGDFGRGNTRDIQVTDGRTGRPGGNAPHQQQHQQQQQQHQGQPQQQQQSGGVFAGRAAGANGVSSAQDVRFSGVGAGQWQEGPPGGAVRQQQQAGSQHQRGPAPQGGNRASGSQGGGPNRNPAPIQQGPQLSQQNFPRLPSANGNAGGGMLSHGGAANNHQGGGGYQHAQGPNRVAPNQYNNRGSGRGGNAPLMQFPPNDMGRQGGRGNNNNGWGMYGGGRSGGRGGGRGFMHHGGGDYMGNGALRQDSSSELSRGPRFVRLQNGQKASVAAPPGIDVSQYNRADFQTKYEKARFFVIKSYSEDDVHKSIKYNVWASTPNGNKRLEAAYKEAQATASSMTGAEGAEAKCPIFFFFSVNASGRFCGCAEMTGPVDHTTSVDHWQQDKWMGRIPVKWHVVKDVLNGQLRHIVLANNENKPVTNSRDTQEIPFAQGLEMLEIFKSYSAKSSLLDDFAFYDGRQKIMEEKRNPQAQPPAPQEQQSADTTAPGEEPVSSLTDAVTAAAASLSLGGASDCNSNGSATTGSAAGEAAAKGARPSPSGATAAAPAAAKSDDSSAPAGIAEAPAGAAGPSSSATDASESKQQQGPAATGTSATPAAAATSAPNGGSAASKDSASVAKPAANGAHASSGSPSKDEKKVGQHKQQNKSSQSRQTAAEKVKGTAPPAGGEAASGASKAASKKST
eukprot:TRINITY_DN110_c0_g1_i1.p1 TRINITY_DN110_c0_g1~~TRINITY_DN110_c0_g1_i1.p1  ORF type:complete len:856 (-),score=221.07 TRINITY_DN110_c0_g1_i1:1604-4171(-)